MTTASLSTDLRVYATKRWPLDKDERRKERLAALLNMTKRRVRSLWENEATAVPRGAEIERIEALIGAEQAEQQKIEEANRDAFTALQERIARLEAIVLSLTAEPDHDALAGAGTGTDRGRRGDVAGAAERGREHDDQSRNWR